MCSATAVSRASNMLTTCAERMPNTMVIWLSETMRPRMCAGLTSAMYMGANAEAMPMPTPPTKRAILNKVNWENQPVPTALTVKSTAEHMSNGFRP